MCIRDRGYYGQDTAAYVVTLIFAETPQEAYTLTGDEGERNGVKTGWYTSGVKVAPADAESYSIAVNAVSYTHLLADVILEIADNLCRGC